jgi:preprotein translocase subunit SecA
MTAFTKLFSDPQAREIKRFQEVVDRINAFEPTLEKFSDEKLKGQTETFRKRLEGGESLDSLLPEAFATVREASKRVLEQRHFDVQLMGGIALHEGKIAEMKTGEGKTLVATLAVYLNALAGQGVHVVTVNDYLARRDAGWMGPIYDALGLSIGVIVHEQGLLFDAAHEAEGEPDPRTRRLRPVTRAEAYAADITYGTNNEFGFDYLRDNMVGEAGAEVQRGHAYAIVDEVDSILIDEARTPLIISQPAEESTDTYYRFAQITPRLERDRHFRVDEKLKAVTLTDEGVEEVERLLGIKDIYESGGIELIHHLEQSLKAQALFTRDRDYVVREGEVIIVDEFTGRLMPGRRYSEGLHQAIEAKEGVEIKRESVTLATITFQNYFRLYEKLAGMTGTASTEAEEFHKIYKLDVSSIPTHRPMIRADLHDQVYKNEAAKFGAVASEIERRHLEGQPVLVGTISIEKSERLSALLTKRGIRHEVLNAKHHEKEAMIISGAGARGAVTIATNMAGRGTDIQLAPSVADVGGLHIIGTERHESRRIDNQLRGRAGRQGDPGSSQFYLSLEDDLMRIFGSERVASVMERLGLPDDVPIEHSLISRSIESAQKKVEGHNFDIRKRVVEYDDVMNRHRERIYAERRRIVHGDDVSSEIKESIKHALTIRVRAQTGEAERTDWETEEIVNALRSILPLESSELQSLVDGSQTEAELLEKAEAAAVALYRDRKERWGDGWHHIERAMLLRTIDMLWIEHLEAMERLREGIGLRGYGQREPLVEYKAEAYNLFQNLLTAIDEQLSRLIFHAEITSQQPGVADGYPERAERAEGSGSIDKHTPPLHPSTPVSGPSSPNSQPSSKLGRNDPCWCGSGKKYKKCHGKET